MKRTPWLPTNRAAQQAMFSNVRAKFPTYSTTLGVDSATEDRVLLICDTFIAVDAHVESCKATMESLIEWRDMIYEKDTKGDAPAVPVFATFTAPPSMFCGIFDEFRAYVDQWKSSPGYTFAIGEDLMIVGNEAPPVPENVSPNLKIDVRPDYTIRVNGKMNGMNALRVEYKRKSTDAFVTIGVLTSLSADISVTPNTPGQPESGYIRAIYLKKNQPFGDYSPDYPVTLS